MSFVLVGVSHKCCGLFMKFNGLTNFEFNCTESACAEFNGGQDSS
jgi:hypothetical protein